MAEQAIIMMPNEFDRLSKKISDQISSEINSIKGMIVERPLTTKEAAEFLQVHSNTLYQLIHDGLPTYKVGRTNYFFPSELAAYIKSKKR